MADAPRGVRRARRPGRRGRRPRHPRAGAGPGHGCRGGAHRGCRSGEATPSRAGAAGQHVAVGQRPFPGAAGGGGSADRVTRRGGGDDLPAVLRAVREAPAHAAPSRRRVVLRRLRPDVGAVRRLPAYEGVPMDVVPRDAGPQQGVNLVVGSSGQSWRPARSRTASVDNSDHPRFVDVVSRHGLSTVVAWVNATIADGCRQSFVCRHWWGC